MEDEVDLRDLPVVVAAVDHPYPEVVEEEEVQNQEEVVGEEVHPREVEAEEGVVHHPALVAVEEGVHRRALEVAEEEEAVLEQSHYFDFQWMLFLILHPRI